MRRLFYCDSVGPIGSVGVLLLRLVVGGAFMFHGCCKIQNPNGPMGWMGPEAPLPGILQALAAITEFGGGAALFLGLLTRLGCLGIGCVMVVALGMVHLPKGDGFVAHKPGESSFELAAVYLACAVMFFLLGAGRYSADAMLFGGPSTPKPHGEA